MKWGVQLSFLILAISFSTLADGAALRSRYKTGNHPKRSEGDEDFSDSSIDVELNKIGDIIKDLSEILDALKARRYGEGNSASVTSSMPLDDAPAATSPTSINDAALRALEQKLADVDKSKNIVTKGDDDDKMFKKVLTKWMERELVDGK